MTEKFTIIKTIDIDVLANKIFSFEEIKQYKPYIFASEGTIKEINKISSDIYKNYRLFVHDGLRFGEIELR